jgi:hypothetical protein
MATTHSDVFTRHSSSTKSSQLLAALASGGLPPGLPPASTNNTVRRYKSGLTIPPGVTPPAGMEAAVQQGPLQHGSTPQAEETVLFTFPQTGGSIPVAR